MESLHNEYVINFLESQEGKDWLNKESSLIMLKEIKDYVTDITPISPNTVNQLIRMFPEFSYSGKAFRFISKPKEWQGLMEWNHEENNHSWSTHKKAYKHVLKSLCLSGHQIQLYQAKVTGLDLRELVSHLREYSSGFGSLAEFVNNESEILVTFYENLELIDSFIE